MLFILTKQYHERTEWNLKHLAERYTTPEMKANYTYTECSSSFLVVFHCFCCCFFCCYDVFYILILDQHVMTEVLLVIADVNTTATLDQMASGDTRAAPVRKAKWHLGEHLHV